MKFLKKLMIPMMFLILGTSCDPTVITVTDTSWYTPVKLSDQAKQWFSENNPHPDVVSALNVVLKNNKKYNALQEK